MHYCHDYIEYIYYHFEILGIFDIFMTGMAGAHLQKMWLETQKVPFDLEGNGAPRGQRTTFRRLQ